MSDSNNLHSVKPFVITDKSISCLPESENEISQSQSFISLLSNPNIIRFLNAFRELSEEESIAYVNENIKNWTEKYREDRKEEEKERINEEKDEKEDEMNEMQIKEAIYANISIEKEDEIPALTENTSTADVCKMFQQRFGGKQPSERCDRDFIQVLMFIHLII